MKLDTPCIGVCSTVYGDDVCRGCKRYYHEVIDWNRYDIDHKEAVMQRLESMIAEISKKYLYVEAEEKLYKAVRHFQIRHAPDTDNFVLAFYCLRHAHNKIRDLKQVGIIARDDTLSATELFTQMDDECYVIACTTFECKLKAQQSIET